MAKKREAKTQDNRRPRLEPRQKETMLMILIRNPQAHVAVRSILKAKHVRDMGDGYAELWQIVCDFYDRQQRLPTQELLLDELQALVSHRPGLIDEDELAGLESFLDWVFDKEVHGAPVSKSKVHCAEALRLAKLYLEESLALTIANTAVTDLTIATDLPALLQEVQTEAAAAGSLLSADAANDQVFAAGWDTEIQVKLRATGMGIFDRFMGGGDAPGETVVFMGPYGSCKSIVAVQGCANAAKQAQTLYATGKTKDAKPKAVFVTAETPKLEFRQRILSCLARIPRIRLADMKSLKDLSRASEPGATKETEYELAFFKKTKKSGVFRSEYDRVQDAITVVNNHLVFIDFTGTDPTLAGVGYGGMRELQGIVAAKFRRYDGAAYPFTFWIDHAAAMAARIMMAAEAAGKTDPAALRTALRNLVLQARDWLSVPYNTSTWIMQQLSGEANSRGPITKVDHTDSDECKSFAMYADHAIVTGKPTEEQLCRFLYTKHRRTPPRSYAIARVDGAFARITDVSNLYVVDEGEHKIVLKETQKNSPAGEAAARRPARQVLDVPDVSDLEWAEGDA